MKGEGPDEINITSFIQAGDGYTQKSFIFPNREEAKNRMPVGLPKTGIIEVKLKVRKIGEEKLEFEFNAIKKDKKQ